MFQDVSLSFINSSSFGHKKARFLRVGKNGRTAMDIAWMKRWEEKHASDKDKDEIANMDKDDYSILLEEIEHH